MRDVEGHKPTLPQAHLSYVRSVQEQVSFQGQVWIEALQRGGQWGREEGAGCHRHAGCMHCQADTARNSCSKNCITDLNYRTAGRAGRAGYNGLLTVLMVHGLHKLTAICDTCHKTCIEKVCKSKLPCMKTKLCTHVSVGYRCVRIVLPTPAHAPKSLLTQVLHLCTHAVTGNCVTQVGRHDLLIAIGTTPPKECVGCR